jgi:hypothetical protein
LPFVEWLDLGQRKLNLLHYLTQLVHHKECINKNKKLEPSDTLSSTIEVKSSSSSHILAWLLLLLTSLIRMSSKIFVSRNNSVIYFFQGSAQPVTNDIVMDCSLDNNQVTNSCNNTS